MRGRIVVARPRLAEKFTFERDRARVEAHLRRLLAIGDDGPAR